MSFLISSLSGVIRSAPRLSALLAVAGAGGLSFILFSGPHGETRDLQKVLVERHPQGMRSCVLLRSGAGIDFREWANKRFWMRSSPWTAPTAHPFLFHAGPADEAPSDLVTDLTQRGVLERHVVPVTFKTSGATKEAVFYTTSQNSPDFSYTLRQPGRLFDGYIPIATRAYPEQVPQKGEGERDEPLLLHPYLISEVDGVCVGLTLRRIVDIRHPEHDPTGREIITATAVYRSDGPKDWMQTPVFRRMAGTFTGLEAGAEVRHHLIYRKGIDGLTLFAEQPEG
ncbi:hypothetical protein LHT11_04530 [Acetobacter indonesiensis]|uniref:hypothetical protein n=1 Tax=Acetobacter TaxID=434 RepID=UPI001EF07969|nr:MULTISPECIES: hypothetical protein [Acetobacter]MCG0994469.1 hypothetical protein [Acetobacter indonesiensis]MCG0997113.1 hypothetical protein [Acetobacter persici]